MLIFLQLLTHDVPYANIERNFQVLLRKGDGLLPNRPQDEQVIKRGLDDGMWRLLSICWSRGPMDRPSIAQLVAELSEGYATIHGPVESLFVAESETDRSKSLNKVQAHTLMSSQLLIVYLPHCIRRRRTMISNLIKINF
jgi:hypothetical protein